LPSLLSCGYAGERIHTIVWLIKYLFCAAAWALWHPRLTCCKPISRFQRKEGKRGNPQGSVRSGETFGEAIC
jgi:hypothetical protein